VGVQTRQAGGTRQAQPTKRSQQSASDETTLLRRARSCLPPGHRIVSASDPADRAYAITRVEGGFALARNGRRLLRAQRVEPIFNRLESDLQLFIAEQARDRLFVHAGVVGWRGGAILLPGRSLAGKSTLVHALVRAGATYYSDEYAVLDDEGRVHPYARPIALRDPPRRVRPRRVGERPLPVSLIVLARYRSGPSAPLALLSPGRCVLALLKQTVAARSRTATALMTLTQIARHAKALYGWRDEAAPFARRLLDLA
jgi:hypothetical protein